MLISDKLKIIVGLIAGLSVNTAMGTDYLTPVPEQEGQESTTQSLPALEYWIINQDNGSAMEVYTGKYCQMQITRQSQTEYSILCY